MHPGAGHNKNTLVNALIYHWPEIAQVGEPKRPGGIVHRLDKETSGVMIVARNQTAYEWLVKQFKGRKVQKSYLALVDGTPPTPTGRIETRIGRDEKIRQRMDGHITARRSQSCHGILHQAGLSGSYLGGSQPAERTHAPDQGAYGFYRLLCGGRPCLW